MKALEILNYIYRELSKNNTKGVWIEPKIIDEAIEELEDLKSRSCSTCRYGRSFHFDKDIECMKLYDATDISENSINNFILPKLHEGLSYEQGTY